MMKKIISLLGIVAIGIVLGLSIQIARADWTPPTSTAPSGNVGAPITTGPVAQNKSGNFSIGATTPNFSAPNSLGGNMDINDVYLRSTGKWVSEMTSGAAVLGQDICFLGINCPVGYYVAGVSKATGDGNILARCCLAGSMDGYCVYNNKVYTTGDTRSTTGSCSCSVPACGTPGTPSCVPYASCSGTQVTTTYTCQSDGTWSSSSKSASCGDSRICFCDSI